MAEQVSLGGTVRRMMKVNLKKNGNKPKVVLLVCVSNRMLDFHNYLNFYYRTTEASFNLYIKRMN